MHIVTVSGNNILPPSFQVFVCTNYIYIQESIIKGFESLIDLSSHRAQNNVVKPKFSEQFLATLIYILANFTALGLN